MNLELNLELKELKEWCGINKLSINLKKTNYTIVKSLRKKNMNVDINITHLQSLPYCWRTNTYLSRPPVPTHSMLFTNRKSANSQGVWTNCAFQH